MELSWKISSKYDGWLVRDYLVDVRAFSDRLLKSVKRDGQMLVNGQNVTVRKTLATGDDLTIIFGKEKRGKGLKKVKMPLNIVYEDQHYMILHKPRGLAIMNDGDRPTLVDGLLYYFDEHEIPFTVHVITRIDRYTSGLVLIAKHRYAHHLLQPEQIKREYVGLVEGMMNDNKGTINLPIARSDESIIKRIVNENGKRAVTHFEVIHQNRDYSLVRFKLETGRTHQIRVHVSHIGHPLVGDDLYGAKNTNFIGQALHCEKLTFIHPLLNKKMTFIAYLPKELQSMFDQVDPIIRNVAFKSV